MLHRFKGKFCLCFCCFLLLLLVFLVLLLLLLLVFLLRSPPLKDDPLRYVLLPLLLHTWKAGLMAGWSFVHFFWRIHRLYFSFHEFFMEIRWYPPNTTPPKKKNRVIYRVLIKALGDDDDLWFLNKALFLGGDIGEEGALRFPRNNTREGCQDETGFEWALQTLFTKLSALDFLGWRQPWRNAAPLFSQTYVFWVQEIGTWIN